MCRAVVLPWLVLAAMAIVWIADTAAYFSGRAFGRRKLEELLESNGDVLVAALSQSPERSSVAGRALGGADPVEPHREVQPLGRTDVPVDDRPGMQRHDAGGAHAARFPPAPAAARAASR